MRIAVVRNRSREGVIARRGQPSPERYGRTSLENIVAALGERGHEVACFEGDKTLLEELEAFIGPEAASGEPGGLVLNLAYGIQGDARYTHVPAMLEMAGVPYTGAGPLGHGVSLDKAVAKTLMRDAGVPTPGFEVLDAPHALPAGLAFPVVVKPRHESTSHGLRLASDQEELDVAVGEIVEAYAQAALVEEYIEGREVCLGLVGNDPVRVLPAVELDFGTRGHRLLTHDDKFHLADDEPAKVCPAPLAPDLRTRLDELARTTFDACHCQDYARVDARIDRHGNPWVLEINSMASLGAGGSFVLAAATAGLGFGALLDLILDEAWRRCAGRPTTGGEKRALRAAA